MTLLFASLVTHHVCPVPVATAQRVPGPFHPMPAHPASSTIAAPTVTTVVIVPSQVRFTRPGSDYHAHQALRKGRAHGLGSTACGYATPDKTGIRDHSA